jgi:hypothetical protein
MATIGDKVTSLTGLALDSANVATTGELNEWILESIVDIINKSITIKPEMADVFGKWATGEYATSGTEIPSKMVLEVMRQTSEGSATKFARANQISRSQKYLATDTESINYVSSHNPAWFWEESSNKSKLVVLPVTSDSDGERYDVKYVHYSTTDTAGATVEYNHNIDTTRVAYFPFQLQHLIPIYCAVKVLWNYIASEMKDASELFQRDKQDDDGSSYEAESFLYWLSQEDSEMIQATQIAQSGELNFLTGYINTMNVLKAEYNEGFGLSRSAQEQQQKQKQQSRGRRRR